MENNQTPGPLASSQHFLFLDALRGVAAVFVMLLHWFEGHGMKLFGSAQLAVDFFFLLSGFVMEHAYGQKLRDGYSKRKYLFLRLIRLYPLILLGAVLGVFRFVATSIAEGDAFSAGGLGVDFLMTILMIPNLVSDGTVRPHLFPLNVPFWSLHFELLACLLFGLIFYASRKSVLLAVIGFSAIGAAMWVFEEFGGVPREYVDGFNHFGYWSSLARLGVSFTMGLLLYRLLRRAPGLPTFPAPVVFLVFMLIVGQSRNVIPPVVAFLILIFGFPCIIALGTKIKSTGSVSKAYTFLGNLSYPLYALHLPVMWSLAGALKVANIQLPFAPVWNGLLILPVTIACSWLAFALYDRPLRTLLRRKVVVRNDGRGASA